MTVWKRRDWWALSAPVLQCCFTAQISQEFNSLSHCARSSRPVLWHHLLYRYIPGRHVFSSSVLVISVVVTSQWINSEGTPRSPLNTASIWGGVSKFRNLGIKEPESGKRRRRKAEAAGKKKENDLDSKVQRKRKGGLHIQHTEMSSCSWQLRHNSPVM